MRTFCMISLAVLLAASVSPAQKGVLKVFNIREYGATGVKTDDAQAAIQSAVDACAASGGGTVYLPAGEYSSGTIHLRSHVRLYLESGAVLYSIKKKSSFDKDALIYGEDLENITIEGRGTIDGQGAYEWRLNDIEDDFIRPNQVIMESLGKPLLRSFPKTDQFGKLFLLLRCTDVRIAGLSLKDSPSWTIHPYGCTRLVIDGVWIRSSVKEGVWADGIDPDGCKDVRISNCTIETGDDAIVFYSMNWFGPALPCENITVTNCRLTSASSAIKFCDGNMNSIRNVTIDNCVITGANRGIAFMDFDGGTVSDVVLSNLTIDCTRHAWFWWGDGDPLHFNVKRRSEVHRSVKPGTDRPAGLIRNVLITNVIARGKGSSICNGHPANWMENVTVRGLRLSISSDPAAPYDKAVDCLRFQQVRNLTLKDVEITWEEPGSAKWRSALSLEDISGLELDGFRGRQASTSASAPAVSMKGVTHALIRNCTAPSGTSTFLEVSGGTSGDIVLQGNDLRQARTPFRTTGGVPGGAVRETMNLMPKQ
jgi:hypothetical protein